MRFVKITAKLPENFESWMGKYFYPLQHSKVYIPRIRYISNVFVSTQGLVIKNFLLVKKCAFNLLGKEDRMMYLPFWKLALEQMLVSKFGKSLKSIRLPENKSYLLIHSKWFNYSFWINSFLVRLIQVEDEGLLKKAKLIYPVEWNNIPYVVESLKCFDVELETIPLDTHVFIKKLIMPETREWTASFYPEHIQKVKEKIVPFALERTTLSEFPKRIYLTRKKRNVRCVENEEEILPILNKYNFTVVNFEDFSFWDQVAMMNNASCFISIHGAGFSNVLFMNENSSVMELVNKSYADMEYKFPFWKLVNACKHKYYVQFGSVLPGAAISLMQGAINDNDKKYLVNENIVIDICLFENNIKSMIAMESINP